jgi:ADP-ribose pyrophosphatase YjhB (NUDIX family)
MTSPSHIRPIAICVVRRGEELFVFEGRDEAKDETFYRPLGGGIEFGEYGVDAVQREMREEIGAEIEHVRYLGTLENIFRLEEEAGHEIVLVYEATFVDPALYRAPELIGHEEAGRPFRALWKPLRDFETGRAPLYPHGLLRLLMETTK